MDTRICLAQGPFSSTSVIAVLNLMLDFHAALLKFTLLLATFRQSQIGGQSHITVMVTVGNSHAQTHWLYVLVP